MFRYFSTLVAWLIVFSILRVQPAVAHGTFHQQMAYLNEQLATKPNDPAILLRMADLYNEHGEWTTALVIADQVEKLAPSEYPTDFVKGQAWLLAEKPEQARIEFDHFLQKNPQNTRGLVMRGRTLDQLGEGQLCVTDFRLAVQMARSQEPELYQEAATMLDKYGHRDEAIAMLDKGIGQIGQVPSLVMAVMQMEISASHYDAALNRVDTIQKTAPRPEPWMAKRAEILTQAGRKDEAKSAWEALKKHLEGLPNLERGSNSMSQLMEQTVNALK